MREALIYNIRRKMAAALVCSLLISQLGAAAPAYGAGSQMDREDFAETETITLRGRIVSLAKNYDVKSDIELQLYVNGKPDTTHKPVIVKAEDTREPWDIYDDSIELINDLGDEPINGGDGLSSATGSDAADYDVWEYRFENLPFEDEEGNEYEYTIRDIAYGPATPSNAKASKTASASNLASSSHAVRGKNGDALFWTNMEGTEVLETGDVEFPAAGARLVYVPYTDVEGIYVYREDSGAETGIETGAEADAESAELVTLELECVSEQDEAFLSNDAEAELDTARGIWRAEHLLMYNPLTCAAIDYRVAAVTGREDYRIRYENRGRYAGYGDYAYDGGTIHHERIAPEEAGTYSVKGIITWEDRDNIWNLRPEDAEFLQIYDEDGKDVTGQVQVQTERTDAGNWSYRIDGLTVGKAYTLRQNLPAYDGENLKDIAVASESKDAVINIPAITETLRTRNMRGLIQWSSYNPLVKTTDSLDFLQVYEGSRDVTNLVSITRNQNAEEVVGRDVWSYTVEGLVEGRDYIIRAKQLDGYTVNPSEVKAETGMSRKLRSANRNMGNASLLEPFNIRSTEPVKLTIENRYYGGSELDGTRFTYTLKTGASETALEAYSGVYVVTSAGVSTEETKTAEDGVINLKAGEKAVVTLKSGTAYFVEQEINSDVLYDVDNVAKQSGILQEDVTKTFINLKKQTLDYQKQWNDNGNKGRKRPASTGTDNSYTNYLELKTLKNGTYITDPEELEKLGLDRRDNITLTISDKQANFWTIHYDDIPVTDEQGVALVYELEEKPIPGYKLTSNVTENAGIYEKIMVNTSYTTFEATKIWMDDSNAYNTRDEINAFAQRLKLYYENGETPNPVTLQTTDPDSDNFLCITPASEAEGSPNKWMIEIKNLIQYDNDGIPYAYYLVEDGDGWSIADTDPKENIRYVAAYENPLNYINEKTRCYTGGSITNKLEGNTNFTFKKEWKDGNASMENRPDITFQLMRYPGNLTAKEGYNHAAPVAVKTYTTPDEKKAVTGEITWIGDTETLLPRYNAEGVEYVYFVKEKLSGTNSSDYAQHVEAAEGADKPVLDELHMNLAAEGETLINRLEKTADIPVTKTWNSAAFSNVDAEIELKVMRQSNAPDAESEKVDIEPALVISGFTPETITRKITVPGMPMYDAEGYRYTYTISEAAIRLKTEKTNGEYQPLVQDEAEGIYKTTKEHYESYQYKFETTSSKVDGTEETILTNTLKDTMNVRVDKIWTNGWKEKNTDGSNKYPTPESLIFTLYIDGVPYSGGMTNPVTISSDDLKPQSGEQKGICKFENLPRYDEDGHEYVYTVKEEVTDSGRVGIITYAYSWEYGEWSNDTDKAIDTRVVDVTNPPPGDGKGFWIEKKWLDDGDKLHREDVTVTVYKKNSEIWEPLENTVTLTEANEWRAHVGIAADAAIDDYTVRETKLGDAAVSYGQDGTLPSEGTVTTSKHTYQVTHTQTNDEWIITNLRTGKVQVKVTKEWLDDAVETEERSGDVTDGHRPVAAKFQLKRNGESIGDEQSTDNNKSQKDTADAPSIHWENLHKYDTQGKLYVYSIEETAVKTGNEEADWKPLTNGQVVFKDKDGQQQVYVSGIESGDYVHDGDVIPFHAVNKRQDTMEISVYKVWKDDGEIVDGKRVRPDIHFKLYRMLKTKLPEEADVTTSGMEPVMVGKTIDADETTDYQEKYVFDPVPRYNDEGKEYVYFVEEGMDGNSNNYEAAYYPCAPEGLKTTEPTVNLLKLSGATGTVVNMRNNTVKITGEKIWKLMGGLELNDYPSITLRLQSKPMYQSGAQYEDVKNAQNETYECTLGSDADGGKNYNYAFSGPEIDGCFPKYNKEGKELAYYVKEVAINGIQISADEAIYQRTSGDRSFVLENTYQDSGEYKVKVTKSWDSVPVGEEGPEATIDLYRVMVDSTGKELAYTKKLYKEEKLNYNLISSGDTQTVEFTDLPKYAPNGRLYHYYLSEKEIGGYDISGDVNRQFFFDTDKVKKVEITNTYNPTMPDDRLTEIKGIKRWADSGNSYGIRPTNADNIQLTLHRKYKYTYTNPGDGSLYKEETLSDSDVNITWDIPLDANGEIWAYTITMKGEGGGFLKYAPNGTEYIYWVTEELIGGNSDATLPDRYTPGSATEVTLAQIASDSNALSITNTPKWTNLTITKTWNDSINGYSTRPDKLTFKIKRRVKTNENNGDWAEYTQETVAVNKTGGNQSVSKKYPAYAKDDSGTISGPYEYIAEEEVPVGYTNESPENRTQVSEDKTLTCTTDITNKLETNSETNVSLKAQKVWEDNDNQDGFRSESITVRLYRRANGSAGDGEFIREQKISSMNEKKTENGVTLEDWSVTWNELPKYMPNPLPQVEAEYYVTEQMDEVANKFYKSMVASASDADTGTVTWTFTNKHNPETVSVHVEKTWQDDGDKWKLRPESIQVALYSGDELIGEQQTLSKENGWKATFSNLPYAKNGTPIPYHVKEIGDIQAYEMISNPETVSPDVKKDIHEGSIALTNKLKDTQLTVNKRWNHGNADTQIEPSAVKIKLQRKLGGNSMDGEWEDIADSEQVLSGSNNWTVTYSQLPQCTNDGAPYNWRAVETAIQIDNEWLSAVITENGVKQLGGYVIEESVPVPGNNGYTQTITNTRCAGNIQVEKIWNHGEKPQSEYPTAVTVQLYKETASGMIAVGAEVILNEVGSWSHTWQHLAKYEKDGITPVVYRMRETSLITNGSTVASIPNGTDPSMGTIGDYDYVTRVEKKDNKAIVTIQNTYSTRDIYAGKVWNDDSNRDGKRPSSIILELYRNGTATGKTVELDGVADSLGETKPWVARWKDVEKRLPDGTEITYTVKEVTSPDGYTVQSQGSTGGGAVHNGTAETPLLITNTHTPERTTYTIEKLWLDDELWKEDVRPDSIQMQLYMTGADGGEIPVGQPVTVRENAAGKWSFTWDDLYKYQDGGKVIRYYAKEIGADGYLSTASGSNALVNRMNTTSLRVSKVWDDMDDYYGMRPDSITVLLQRKAQGDTSWTTLPEAKVKLTMDSSSGWGAAELTGLPTHDKQNRPYEYRAVEAAIGEQTVTGGKGAGYEVVYEHQPNALTKPGETEITNRLATGSLEVTKTLRGGSNTDFSFLVELTANGQTGVYKGPYRVNPSGDVRQTAADGAITIQGGQKFIIDRIPEGMSYTVTEQEKTGYRQVSKDGDAGAIKAGETATAEFINQRNSSGGGGGGGGNTPPRPDTTKPSGGPGVVPEEPDGPGVVDEPTQPEQPEAPAEPDITDTGRLPEIPVTPERRPDIPTGTIVEVRNPAEPNGPPLYRGEYDRNRGFTNIPSGRYELVTLDENGVPLGSLPIYIDDEGVPLALPRTGDRRIPSALLAAALASSAAALAWIGRRRRKKEQE